MMPPARAKKRKSMVRVHASRSRWMSRYPRNTRKMPERAMRVPPKARNSSGTKGSWVPNNKETTVLATRSIPNTRMMREMM